MIQNFFPYRRESLGCNLPPVPTGSNVLTAEDFDPNLNDGVQPNLGKQFYRVVHVENRLQPSDMRNLGITGLDDFIAVTEEHLDIIEATSGDAARELDTDGVTEFDDSIGPIIEVIKPLGYFTLSYSRAGRRKNRTELMRYAERQERFESISPAEKIVPRRTLIVTLLENVGEHLTFPDTDSWALRRIAVGLEPYKRHAKSKGAILEEVNLARQYGMRGVRQPSASDAIQPTSNPLHRTDRPLTLFDGEPRLASVRGS